MNKSWLRTLTNKVPAAWLKNSAANCRSHHLEEVLWPPDELGCIWNHWRCVEVFMEPCITSLGTAVHEPLQNDNMEHTWWYVCHVLTCFMLSNKKIPAKSSKHCIAKMQAARQHTNVQRESLSERMILSALQLNMCKWPHPKNHQQIDTKNVVHLLSVEITKSVFK